MRISLVFVRMKRGNTNQVILGTMLNTCQRASSSYGYNILRKNFVFQKERECEKEKEKAEVDRSTHRPETCTCKFQVISQERSHAACHAGLPS